MSKVIFKYPLNITEHQTLLLPEGAKILTVQVQNGIACLWALIDTLMIEEHRTIKIYGTGNPIVEDVAKSNLNYIATFQTGAYVFHVFEATE